MAVPDPVQALVEFLKADAAVAALAGTRVFGGELPRGENTSMPRQAAVISPAGGPGDGSYQRWGRVRIDVDCYGSTPKDSWDLYLVVFEALRHLRREVRSGVLLHSATVSARGSLGRDPDTDWPVTLSSWLVLASETAAP